MYTREVFLKYTLLGGYANLPTERSNGKNHHPARSGKGAVPSMSSNSHLSLNRKRKLPFFLFFLASLFIVQVVLISGGRETAVSAATTAIKPELDGTPFYVGGFTSDETAPAVAYSLVGDQYLVVFQTNAGNGNVWGQFVDALTGSTVGDSFAIASDASVYEGNPDVVYDSVHHRFLVVWDEFFCLGVPAHCNYVIKGVVVHGLNNGGGSNLAGSPFTVASQWSSITSGNDLRDPAVAFNGEDGQFGVVFLQGHENTGYPAIYGQIVDADYSSPTVLTPTAGFEIWDTSTRELKTPDIAWSSSGDTFATVWNADRDDGNPDYIATTYLYDAYQNGGSQVLGSFVTAPIGTLQYDTRQPVITFDATNNNFVVAFVHQEGTGLLSSSTIRGQRLRDSYSSGGVVLNNFDVETTLDTANDFHRNPGITYSPFDEQIHISYWTQDVQTVGFQTHYYNWVYLRAFDSSNTASERLQIRYAGELLLEHTATACNPGGHCLVAWREEYSSSDWDILGQLTLIANDPAYSVYLPLIIK